MAENQLKIVFLSGGSLVGQNVLMALEGRRSDCKLIALNSIATEPALYYYDKAYLVPSLVKDPEEFRKKFNEIFKEENPDLIVPCRDEDVFFLAEFGDKNPDIRNKLLVGPLKIAESMLDKNLSFEFSQELDLPFVPTIRANSGSTEVWKFAEKHRFPLLVKPVKGFASLGVRILFKEEQLQSVLGEANLIIQQYIGRSKDLKEYLEALTDSGVPLFHSFEEEKISVQGCISSSGEVLEVFVTKHIMKNGVSAIVETCRNPQIFTIAKKWVQIIAKSGWRGPINIQSQYDEDGGLFIYEYNGRFTGATSARVLLDLDEVGITLNSWLGNIFPVRKFSDNSNSKVLRAPVSRLVAEDRVSGMKANGYWEKEKLDG